MCVCISSPSTMGLFWASPSPPPPPARPQLHRWEAKTRSELQLQGMEVEGRPDHVTEDGIEFWYVGKEGT